MNTNDLNRVSVDMAKLSTNFIDIVSDCNGAEGFTARNVLNDKYPLTTWLLNTAYARLMRARSTDPQNFARGEDTEWEMKVPGTVYTLEPANSGNECCWAMPDFAKCAADVPLYLLCLKDCDTVMSNLLYSQMEMTRKTIIEGLAQEGETAEQTNERIRRLWMAFYTAHTAVLGTSETSDNIVKPFHGLVEVLENPAVAKIYGGSILAAFDSLGCRLAVLGGDDYVIAVNPLIYESILSVVVPGQNGLLPAGWTRDGDTVKFRGIGFIQDRLVPVDMTTGTGEAWLLDGASVGLFLGSNIMPEGKFIVRDDFTHSEENCGEKCTYYYNYGAVANNNANRLAVITDIPVSAVCTTALAGLSGLINENTLIPA